MQERRLPIQTNSPRTQVRNEGANEEANQAQCSGRPYEWHADADQQSNRSRRFEDPQQGHPGFRHAHSGHVDADLFVADEVECGRKYVSSSGHDSNNEISDKHELRSSFFKLADGVNC